MKITAKPNIGGKDRELRLIGGSILTLIGCITKKPIIKTAGCVLLTTGIARKCVFYDLLGIDTTNS